MLELGFAVCQAVEMMQRSVRTHTLPWGLLSGTKLTTGHHWPCPSTHTTVAVIRGEVPSILGPAIAFIFSSFLSNK